MNQSAVVIPQAKATGRSSGLGNIMRDLNRDVWCILGLPFDATTEAATCEHLLHCIDTRQKCLFTTPNLNFVVTASRDDAFRQSVIDSDWVVADGMPIIWVAKRLGIPLKERVAGSNVFEALRQDARRKQRKLKVVFFGGPDGVAAEAFKKIAIEDSAMDVVGFYSPGFGSIEEMSPQHVIDQINDSEADIVVVALGAKRGQAWIDFNRHRLKVPILTHLGAVVNFVAGSVTRAPRWIQKSGLEWAWRITEERSLLSRYWNDGLAFLKLYINTVQPYEKLIKRERPANANTEQHIVRLEANKTTIFLAGSYHSENLSAFILTLAKLISHGKSVEIDCREVRFIDSRFLGLMLTAKKHLNLAGLSIELTNCPEIVVKILSGNRLSPRLLIVDNDYRFESSVRVTD